MKFFAVLLAALSFLFLFALAAPGHTFGDTAPPEGIQGCNPTDTSKCTEATCNNLTGSNQTAQWDSKSKTCTVGSSDAAAAGGNCASLDKCDLMTKYINPLIQLLAVLVGVAVTISIIIGGIQYGSSAGDPQKASAAKARIRNAIIALLTFLFLYGLLNFLVPGGLFNK